MLAPIKSSTTQNTIAGVTVIGTIILWLISSLRTNYPDLLWDSSYDEQVVLYLTSVLGPLLSRQIAFLREPEKKDRAK